ncbi:MAG: hypothetical protein ABJQ41_12055 [Marinomonas sp.]
MLRRVLSGMAALPLSGSLLAANRGALRLPPRPMRLTRILERGLGDGKMITVERQWSVAFSRMGRTVQITGNQIAARVDAPERLAPLAKIEEARIANGMFPLLLSDSGILMGPEPAKGSASSDKSAMTQAIAVAEDMIARSGRSPSDTAQAMRHLAQMQEASQPLFATMPRDLFFPTGAAIRDIRAVNLPDGSVGEFELTYNARAVPEAGWLAKAERQIITRLGGDARQSREIWSLESMAV